MKDSEKIERLSDLLKSAMEALRTIEQATVDEHDHCCIRLACSECPMRNDAYGRCKWVREDEARALLGGSEHG